MFEVTGYQLRNALRRWTLKRDAATQAFPKTLYAFESENKQTPDDAMAIIAQAEAAIAALQTAQTRYNLAVLVQVPPGAQFTLAQAVKVVGQFQRAEKLWRSAAGLAPKDPRYSYREGTDFDAPAAKVVEKDKVVLEARPQLSPEELTSRAGKINHTFGLFQAAIAEANAKKVNIDVDPGLFE